MIRLTLKEPGSNPKTLTIENDVAIIGRSNDCSIPIQDTKASRMHCQIVKTSQGFEVIDLGSSNGTRVNGQPARRHPLRPGDAVEVGETAIVFEGDGRPPAPAILAPDPQPLDDVPVARLPDAVEDVPVARLPESAPARRPSSSRLEAARGGSSLLPFLALAAAVALVAVPVYMFVIAPKDADPVADSASLKSREVKSGTTSDLLDKIDREESERKKREEEIKRKADETWARGREEQEKRYAAESTRRAEEERRKAEEEKAATAAKKAADDEARAKRRTEDAAVFAVERKRFDALAPECSALLHKLNFEAAAGRIREFHAEAKTEAAQELAVARSDEIAAMKAAFTRMWQNVKPGQTVKVNDRAVKVQSASAAGFSGQIGMAQVTKKWAELDAEDVGELLEWGGMTAEDRYGAALLCFELGLEEAGEAQLADCVKADPARKPLLDQVVARARGIAAPAGGFVVVSDRWLTPEEKGYWDKGLRLQNGKWMTEEEVNLAKGLVLKNGKWVTKEEAEDEEELERQVSRISAKGYIDKDGWYEGTPWAEAIVVETAHYKIKSNLKPEAVKDAGYIMEWLYYNFCKVFRFTKRMQKFEVWIGGTRQDYMAYGEGHGQALGHCTSSGVISTFYQPPITLMVLMHEGTHQFLFRIAPTCPLWMHEGMATFFECSKFKVDVKRKELVLQIGLLNRNRLFAIQRDLKAGSAASLDQFVRGNGGDPYSQGWSLVYYIVNAQKGRYARFWLDFVKDVGKGDPMKWFKKWLGVTDLKAFEEDWKKFTLDLDPSKGEDQNVGHK